MNHEISAKCLSTMLIFWRGNFRYFFLIFISLLQECIFFEIRVNFLLLIRLTIFFGMSYLEDTEIKKTNLNLLGLKQLALKTKALQQV